MNQDFADTKVSMSTHIEMRSVPNKPVSVPISKKPATTKTSNSYSFIKYDYNSSKCDRTESRTPTGSNLQTETEFFEFLPADKATSQITRLNKLSQRTFKTTSTVSTQTDTDMVDNSTQTECEEVTNDVW